MEISELKVDLKELEEFKKKNFEERLKFIDFLVDYIKKNPNKVWSRQQKNIVDTKTA
ncbi:TPA: hypothetical protein H1012_04575 [archaeon]|nr:hypothetical protein [Candidatus Naiadarchaeales archaeon SRR2090159.bin1288]